MRVSPEGYISDGPHPAALGSALTNPYITTDFAEALLEFITPVHTDIDECLDMLKNIHHFSLQNLDANELLWVASMPCPHSSEVNIPIAEYGNSNIGRLKNLYRRGLHVRYGSLMQVISGIHYNFSMPAEFWEPFQQLCGDSQSLSDFKTTRYLHLIRNFHRYSWLLVYLFGASPAACNCFVEGRNHGLQQFDAVSLYLPEATCLRMGNLGYKSEAQESLFVCYNELQTYVDCLYQAMYEPYPEYDELGQKCDGDYQQINTCLLQLENEFYSTIRPKPKINSGERPLDALIKYGIEYVEVRALDLNPYLPVGIDAQDIRFLDTFLLHCLLSDSARCDQREFFEVATNLAAVVERGRDPELQLNRGDKMLGIRDWAEQLLDDMAHSATLLDQVHHSQTYNESVRLQQAKVRDASLTPSGRMLKQMREQELSFFELAMNLSKSAKKTLQNCRPDDEVMAHFADASAISHQRQKEIEEADTQSFDEFLEIWNRK